jgi:serine/threonine protein kinase
MRDSAIASGTRAGDYELLAPIAEGGFGQVYRARHAGTGRVAAVKVLHGELCNAPGAVARFLREAEVMVRIRHPAVVELLACGTVEDGRPYLAMELLEGVDLARVLARESRLAPARVLGVLEPVAAALAAAHAQSVIHRDVKASNVFLADDGGGRERVLLLDFGIAKLALPDATDLTTSRQAVGTPVTMAPEQIAGGTVDARTDVYGLGVLAFHLLTGRLPFEDESHTVVQYLHAHARRSRRCPPRPTTPSSAPWRSTRRSASPIRSRSWRRCAARSPSRTPTPRSSHARPPASWSKCAPMPTCSPSPTTRSSPISTTSCRWPSRYSTPPATRPPSRAAT